MQQALAGTLTGNISTSLRTRFRSMANEREPRLGILSVDVSEDDFMMSLRMFQNLGPSKPYIYYH